MRIWIRFQCAQTPRPLPSWHGINILIVREKKNMKQRKAFFSRTAETDRTLAHHIFGSHTWGFDRPVFVEFCSGNSRVVAVTAKIFQSSEYNTFAVFALHFFSRILEKKFEVWNFFWRILEKNTTLGKVGAFFSRKKYSWKLTFEF